MTRQTLCAAALALALAACSTPEAPPLLSLDGPSFAADGHTCLVGDAPRQRLAPDDCEGTLAELTYITNRLGDSVAVISMSQRLPEVLDTRANIPGVSHILVGRGPTHIVASYDGNFLFVFNEIDGDISLVSADSRRELQRVPVGEQVSALWRTRAEDGAEAVWALLPASGRLLRLTWGFTCDGDAVYVEGCAPEVNVAMEAAEVAPPGAIPRDAALSPDQRSVFVTYANRPWLDEWRLAPDDARPCLGGGESPCAVARVGLTYGCEDGLDNDGDGLVDARDPQCLSPRGAESPDGIGRALAAACADGIDNDGDGLIDARDGGCTFAGDDSERGGAAPAACEDGLDNDGDGLADEDDPNCVDPTQAQEQRTPQCADGIDNDEDQLIDANDPDCADPLAPIEGAAGGACADGIDNDQDGAADGADPGCVSLEDTSEAPSPTACSDGEDNDGDGLVDVEDPECYGSAGGAEANERALEFGPLAVDPQGRYVYVVDRVGTQLLVVDREAGALLDPLACAEGDLLCRPRPFDDRIGVPVGRLPTAVMGRRRQFRTPLDEGRTGSEQRVLIREVAFASVSATAGALFSVIAHEETWVQREQLSDGEVLEIEGEPIAQRRLRLEDGRAARARGSAPRCTLSAELLERVRAARGGGGQGEILCDDALLPQLTPLPQPCSPEEEGCVCEGEACALDLGDEPAVQVLKRRSVGWALDLARRDAVVVDTYAADDFYNTTDSWRVTWEGVILERQDGVVDAERPGWVRVGGDLCGAGVEAGDRVTILSSPTPLSGGGEGCEAFRERALTWRVAEVQAGALRLELIAPAGDEAPPLVEALPTRACFAAGVRFQVRPHQLWVVEADDVGLLVNRRAEGGACVPRFAEEARYNFRARAGEVFENPYVSFVVTEGEVELPQDFRFNFNTLDEFSERILRVGPSTAQLFEVETAQGRYMFVIDTGSNLVRVFDAETDAALSILF